jgi:hypothetical protein
MRDMNARVIAAAKVWWKEKRPLDYSYKKHLENPTINTTTEAEKTLARAVASYERAKKNAL